MKLPRWLNPATDPHLYHALIGAIIAVFGAINHHQSTGWPAFGLGVAQIVMSAISRSVTTPVLDPKDEHGSPLVAAPVSPPAARPPILSTPVNPPPGGTQ